MSVMSILCGLYRYYNYCSYCFFYYLHGLFLYFTISPVTGSSDLLELNTIQYNVIISLACCADFQMYNIKVTIVGCSTSLISMNY